MCFIHLFYLTYVIAFVLDAIIALSFFLKYIKNPTTKISLVVNTVGLIIQYNATDNIGNNLNFSDGKNTVYPI